MSKQIDCNRDDSALRALAFKLVWAASRRYPAGYDYWILESDGVTALELGEPNGFGRIEYAYYLMAMDAGIDQVVVTARR